MNKIIHGDSLDVLKTLEGESEYVEIAEARLKAINPTLV